MQTADTVGPRTVQEMIGRERELAEIRSFLEGDGGGGRVLRIEGEAGIGKSTLWRAGRLEAERLGYRVLACAAAVSESQLSFTTVRDLLAPEFDEVAARLPEPQRRALAVAFLQAEPTGSPPEPATIAVAFLTSLRLLAQRAPVLVAVDDVQWVDRASAGPLAYARRRLEQERIALLVARRLGEEDPTSLGHDGSADVAVEVDGLSIGALARVLDERLGIALPRPTLVRLHEASGGNPFFALELARALAQTPTALAPGAHLPVPTSLYELIQARLQALPAETLEALAYLAVTARADVALLGGALGNDDPTLILAPALEARVIEVAERGVRFSHPLLASGVLDLVSAGRLRDVHKRLAAVIEDGEQRARHLALGADGPDAGIATALEESARRTNARGHRIVAAELYEAAARFTPAPDTEDRARRVLAAAAALFDAGDAARAATSIEQLLTDTALRDVRVDAQLLLGKILADVGRRHEAMQLWAEALEATTDPAAVADIRSCLAGLSIYTGSSTEAVAHADRALAAAQRAGSDTGGLAYAYAARALAGVVAGDSSYLIYLEKALELEPVGAIRSSAWDWSPTHVAAACALHTVDIDEIRLRFGAMFARAVDSGNADMEQYGAYGLAQAELATGDLERAAALIDIVEELASGDGRAHASRQQASRRARGSCRPTAEARARLEAVIADSEAVGERRYSWQARAALGALALAEGRAKDAADELRKARALAEEVGMRDPALVVSFVDEVEAAGGSEPARSGRRGTRGDGGSR